MWKIYCTIGQRASIAGQLPINMNSSDTFQRCASPLLHERKSGNSWLHSRTIPYPHCRRCRLLRFRPKPGEFPLNRGFCDTSLKCSALEGSASVIGGSNSNVSEWHLNLFMDPNCCGRRRIGTTITSRGTVVCGTRIRKYSLQFSRDTRDFWGLLLWRSSWSRHSGDCSCCHCQRSICVDELIECQEEGGK